MRNVFKDPALEAEFNEKGYVQVPFLSPEEVEYLKNAYFETLSERGGSMLGSETDFKNENEITYDFTFIDRKPDYKRKVFDLIVQVFERHWPNVLDNYTPIIANFIRKEHDSGEVPLHQNWAFIDECKATSVSIWCPLVDSGPHNGTLQMVDGSHKKFGKIRGPMIPWELEKIKGTIIGKYLTPMVTKAGNAVVLDDSIVHYSDVNASDGLRLTIQLILIPTELASIHYHMNPQQSKEEVHVLEVDQNFYMEFHPWQMPKGVRELGHLTYQHKDLTEAEFLARMKGPRFDIPQPEMAAPQGFFGKIKSLFS